MKAGNQFTVFHRQSGSRLYKLWAAMKERCHNPNDSSFSRYGARGIYVCESWRTSYEAFAFDMGPRPPNTSLDRIDNDGPYSPANCRWATTKEQARNKRGNHHETLWGETKTLVEWTEDPRCAVALRTLRVRLHRQWAFEKAMTTPPAWRGMSPRVAAHRIQLGLAPVPRTKREPECETE